MSNYRYHLEQFFSRFSAFIPNKFLLRFFYFFNSFRWEVLTPGLFLRSSGLNLFILFRLRWLKSCSFASILQSFGLILLVLLQSFGTVRFTSNTRNFKLNYFFRQGSELRFRLCFRFDIDDFTCDNTIQALWYWDNMEPWRLKISEHGRKDWWNSQKFWIVLYMIPCKSEGGIKLDLMPSYFAPCSA
jgi:hypothetical protein